MQTASNGPFEAASLPDDAVELGRFHGPWGIKGWIHVQSYSPDADVLFKAEEWFLLPPETQRKPGPKAAASVPGACPVTGPTRVAIRSIKDHSDGIVAQIDGVDNRNIAETLKGVRIFVSRASFPAPADGEFYWIDLIGLQVVNREGVLLGTVKDLMSTGPHSVLVLESSDESSPVDGKAAEAAERLIPFVDAYVDEVDIAARRISVDWQADY